MSKGPKKISAPLVLVLLAALVLAAGGAFAASDPDILSESYMSEFEMTNVGVALLENGETDDRHALLTDIKDDLEPGRVYDESVAVKNTGDSQEIVRVVVRKYWLDENGNKTNHLDPEYICFSYEDEEYNTGAWQIDRAESTAERTVYYYSSLLAPGKTTSLLFNKLRIDPAVADEMDIRSETSSGRKVYTYSYRYDGCSAHIEAEAQVIQDHNGNDAIEGVWGVGNVSVDGSAVTVEQEGGDEN